MILRRILNYPKLSLNALHIRSTQNCYYGRCRGYPILTQELQNQQRNMLVCLGYSWGVNLFADFLFVLRLHLETLLNCSWCIKFSSNLIVHAQTF